MRNWKFLLVISFIYCNRTEAQEELLKVSVNKDTLALHEILQYEVVLENITGQVELPTFTAFSVVSGPNTSSSFSMINGQVRQSKTYQVYLKPVHSGLHTIGPVVVKTNQGNLESQSVRVFVRESVSDSSQESQVPSDSSIDKNQSHKASKRILRKI